MYFYHRDTETQSLKIKKFNLIQLLKKIFTFYLSPFALKTFVPLCLCGLIFFSTFQAFAQTVPTPKNVLGFQPTDDRTIADWNQILDYFAKLDKASPKVKVEEIGKTTLGKSQIVAFISSAKNISNLQEYKTFNEITTDPRNRLMTTPETVGGKPNYENILVDDPIGSTQLGKTIVAISCSIHSTEIVASQMSMLLAHKLATATDEKTKNILDNTILLLDSIRKSRWN